MGISKEKVNAEVSPSQIILKENLNKLGTFKVDINFHSEVKAKISIKIDKIQSKYLISNLNFIPERFKISISLEDHKKSIKYARDKLDLRIKRNTGEILFLGILTFGGLLDGLTQYTHILSLSLRSSSCG